MSARLLMITRAFYPNNASGSHRVAKMAKYLPLYGWEPTVLCADWTPENCAGNYDPQLAQSPPICPTVTAPYHRSSLSGISAITAKTANILRPYTYPQDFYRAMVRAAEKLLRREHFDAVWSTFIPGLTHAVAARISHRLQLPWLADFRDLPDQTTQNWRIRRIVRAEQRYCRSANALITTSTTLATRLRQRHPQPVHVILNGFDHEDFPPPPAELSPKFTIRYFGTLYCRRDPRPLFAALDQLLHAGRINEGDVAVEFYGADPDALAEFTRDYHCRSLVSAPPRLPHREMIARQQTAQILLLLKSSAAGGPIPAKLYEYLAAGRPILNIPGDQDVVDAILTDTNAGLSLADPTALAERLHHCYQLYRRQNALPYHGIPDRITQYTRKRQAGQLAAILDEVTAACTEQPCSRSTHRAAAIGSLTESAAWR